MTFPTDISTIESRILQVNPVKYAKTRNYENGAVSYLSPYISRGVISTKKVFNHVLNLGLEWTKIEKFVQELAWRDYWQQVWLAKGEDIFKDLKHTQIPVKDHQISKDIIDATTGINAIDEAINKLYETGYMHNHMRMYLAAIACNFAHSHWSNPAEWMYAHLLDGDLASNTLSWQWVAGANANKKYVANQENINKYFNSNQAGTFLDKPYEELNQNQFESSLSDKTEFSLSTDLPETDKPTLEHNTTLIYNYYNLDPNWHKNEDVNRVLLLEPSVFERFPIASKCLNFMLDLAKNINGIQIYVGEFSDLQILGEKFIFKEHPLNRYQGIEERRDWMFKVTGLYNSFFGFWKKCKKELKYEFDISI